MSVKRMYEALKVRTMVRGNTLGALRKMCSLYGQAPVAEAIDKIPLGHPNPIGYIRKFCTSTVKNVTQAPRVPIILRRRIK